jgi:hypothetical protein
MADDVGRPQDQGRKHRRGGNPSPETASLLADYHQAMRDDLRAVLDDIRGHVPDPGLRLLDDAIERGDIEARIKSPLKERIPMWDLAIKLGRELGTEVDGSPAASAAQPPTPRKRSRSRIDFG